jgi:branched-chain amino acid transport system ATP-binding protein
MGGQARPKVRLLDKPSLGLVPQIVAQVDKVIADIRRQGTTVLLVEQNAHMALGIANRGYVLATGALVAQGRPPALWANAEIQAAYLGGRRVKRPTQTQRSNSVDVAVGRIIP